MDFDEVKLEIDVPEEYALKLRDELTKINACRVGDYDHCVSLVRITGYFRPLEGANPYSGTKGEVFRSEEVELQVRCKREYVNEAIRVIKEFHPYEEPLVNIIPLANHLFDDTTRKLVKDNSCG
jgi:hypothetical protein